MKNVMFNRRRFTTLLCLELCLRACRVDILTSFDFAYQYQSTALRHRAYDVV